MKATLMSFFVCVCALFTGLVYADFSDSSFGYEVVEMDEYTPITVREVLSAPEGKTLVPEGAILGVNDVTEVSYAYEVLVEEGYELTIDILNILFNQENESYANNDLLEYAIEVDTEGEFTLVYVSISLKMPANKTEYTLIKGSTVSFDIVFNQNII